MLIVTPLRGAAVTRRNSATRSAFSLGIISEPPRHGCKSSSPLSSNSIFGGSPIATAGKLSTSSTKVRAAHFCQASMTPFGTVAGTCILGAHSERSWPAHLLRSCGIVTDPAWSLGIGSPAA